MTELDRNWEVRVIADFPDGKASIISARGDKAMCEDKVARLEAEGHKPSLEYNLFYEPVRRIN